MPRHLAPVPQGSRDSEELEALNRGDITLDEYLDRKVDRALGHWQSRMSPVKLAALREAIRVQLATHPVSAELVRRATGQDPNKATG